MNELEGKISSLETQIATMQSHLHDLKKTLENSKATIVFNNCEWMLSTKYLDYSGSIEFAETLSDGWRLPTIQEIIPLYDFTNDRSLIDFNSCRLSGTHWTIEGYTL